MMQKQLYVFLNTNGSGYWSDAKKTVLVEYISCDAQDDDFAELCVKFNTQTWNVDADGLIYTDKQFLHELRAALIANGFSAAAANDVEYSCDVGAKFIKAFKTNTTLAPAVVKEEDYLDS
jgi:hypothetical protein